MADNLTNGEEDRLLDLSLPTTANACQLRLTSTAPTDAAAGTELSGNGYVAQDFTVAASSGGSKSNPQILFPAATGAWSTIVGYEVWVGTERRWYRALTAGEQRTLASGDQYRIQAGQLTFSLS